jgi:hypothetical protein
MGVYINVLKIKTQIRKATLIIAGAVTAIVPLFSVIPVLAVSDTTAPTITALNLVSQATVPATEFGGLIEVTGNFTDDLSGFNGGTLTYTSPSGHQTAVGDFSAYSPGYYAAPTINAYPEQGTWVPSLRIVDHAGNTKVYSNSELVSQGYNLSVTISGGTSDTTAPTVTNLALTTSKTIAATEFGAYVEIASDYTDDLSGFNGGTLTYTSPSGNQSTGLSRPATPVT